MFGKVCIAQNTNNVAGEIKCVTCGRAQPSRQKPGMGRARPGQICGGASSLMVRIPVTNTETHKVFENVISAENSCLD